MFQIKKIIMNLTNNKKVSPTFIKEKKYNIKKVSPTSIKKKNTRKKIQHQKGFKFTREMQIINFKFIPPLNLL